MHGEPYLYMHTGRTISVYEHAGRTISIYAHAGRTISIYAHAGRTISIYAHAGRRRGNNKEEEEEARTYSERKVDKDLLVFRGLILRDQLIMLLKNKIFFDEGDGVSVNDSLLIVVLVRELTKTCLSIAIN